jgi:hypothetical protein
LNDFELKRFVFEKSLKKAKEKKEKEPHLPFSPAAHRPTSPSPAVAHLFSPFFFFFCVANGSVPLVSPPSPSPRPFPSFVQDRRAAGIPTLHRTFSASPLPTAGSNQGP